MGTIAARNGHALAQVRLERDDREQLPQLTERTMIAMESLRTQWRTIADLGTHERMAISQLRTYGSMPMSDLAARISLSRAAVTSLVDRLEADGWVRRQADDHDRRRTVLQLLPRAAADFERVSESFNGELVAWANDMSTEEWRVASSFLDRLRDIADRHADRLRTSANERTLA